MNSLIEKFNSVKELPVSEELIGAFLENTLIGSDMREVSNFMNANPHFATSLTEQMPCALDNNFGNLPNISDHPDSPEPDILDAWQLPNPEVFLYIYDDVFCHDDMLTASSQQMFPDNPLDNHIDNPDIFDDDNLLNDFSLPSDL